MATNTATLSHRQTSGLVRAGRPLDAALFNFVGATFGPVIAWVLLFGVGFYPGSSILLTIAIAFALTIGMNLSYAFFASIMPRSGGDFVFISRTLHPWLGFVANASFVIWVTFYIGIAGALFGELGLGPAFRVIAATTGDHGLATVGEWFTTDAGKFISGIAMMLLTGPVVLMGRNGLRSYFKFQKVVFILAAVLLVITVGAMLIMGHDGFRSSFDSYSAHFTGHSGAYAAVVKEGGGHGAFDFKQTLLACTWPFYGSAFLVMSAYWAGEGRTGLKAQLLGITLPLIVALFVMLGVVGLGLQVFGTDFLTGLAIGDPSVYGGTAAPYFTELTATWTGPVIGAAICLGLGTWVVSYVPVVAIMNTRSMLAWSMDGIAPAWVGKVDTRSANPVNATLLTFAVAVIFLGIYSFTSWLSVASALLASALTFFMTCVAATVFPFVRRELFRGSPGDIRLGRLPLMAVVGAVGSVGMAVMIWVLLNDPSSGISWDGNRGAVIAVGVILAFAVAVYWLAALVRKRQGVDIAASYRSLPPE